MTLSIYNSTPWVEKYRPDNFDDIIIDSDNREIFNNMVENNELKNILFYGPPGTGKTTTIVNLIKKYQEHHNQNGKELVIHLNASDERGIDIIRTQIYSFANSHSLFNKGKKFVILDEVDYMTKSAQQALKTLITEFKDNICFCLICNYISRIEKPLQIMFIQFRFNKLLSSDIICFLEKVVKGEKLNLSSSKLEQIQKYFNSDIRSMINYIQINHKLMDKLHIINKVVFNEIFNSIINKSVNVNVKNIYNHSIKHNMSKRDILKNMCFLVNDFIINNQIDEIIVDKVVKIIQFVLHDTENEIDFLIRYFISNIKTSGCKSLNLISS